MLKIAIIQGNPTQPNLATALARTLKYIRTAANEGARLIVFGETWLCGYPTWLDYCPGVALWDHRPTKNAYQEMYENGVVVGGPTTQVIEKIAGELKVNIVMGINEVVPTGPGNGTIYNGLLIFSERGKLEVHHRKLMPTFTEKLIYGTGDGHGLKTMDTSFGRLGGLICWEHYMPLARQAMHEAGEHIHIALWPKVHDMLQLASRTYAFEGRCFVVAVGQIISAGDIPEGLELPEELAKEPNQLLLNGGSCVIGPDGQFRMAPVFDREGIFYHQIESVNEVLGARMALDVTGHYNRRDVFDFKVNSERK